MEQLLDENVLGKTTLRYAGFWKRFFAAFIDGIIIGIPTYIITYLLSGMPILANLIGIVIAVGYFVYFESGEKMGGIGKQALGLKVIDEATQGRITPVKALGRYFGRLLSAVILMIGYFMMLFNDKNQTLHDKLAGTVVVNA